MCIHLHYKCVCVRTLCDYMIGTWWKSMVLRRPRRNDIKVAQFVRDPDSRAPPSFMAAMAEYRCSSQRSWLILV